jgi:hypothetical protein
MSITGFVLAGRRQAEALMVDRCTIRPVTATATNPTTGVVSSTLGAAVYTGKCKIQSMKPFRTSPAAGERVWTIGPDDIHLPVTGTAAVGTGQIVEITSSPDPANVGRKFRVHSGDRKTFQTAIRLFVEEVLG